MLGDTRTTPKGNSPTDFKTQKNPIDGPETYTMREKKSLSFSPLSIITAMKPTPTFCHCRLLHFPENFHFKTCTILEKTL